MIMIGGGGYFVKNKVTTPILKHHNSIRVFPGCPPSSPLPAGTAGSACHQTLCQTGNSFDHRNVRIKRALGEDDT